MCGHAVGSAPAVSNDHVAPLQHVAYRAKASGGFPTKLIALVVASVLAISVVGGAFGCSSRSRGSDGEGPRQEQQAPEYHTFEEYLANYPEWIENSQAQANEIAANDEALGSWEVRVSGNQIVFDLTVSEEYTAYAQLGEIAELCFGGDGSVSSLIEWLGVGNYLPNDRDAVEMVESIENAIGLDGVTLQYRFWWSNGNEIIQSDVYHS